jgi:hypothetical protein
LRSQKTCATTLSRSIKVRLGLNPKKLAAF